MWQSLLASLNSGLASLELKTAIGRLLYFHHLVLPLL